MANVRYQVEASDDLYVIRDLLTGDLVKNSDGTVYEVAQMECANYVAHSLNGVPPMSTYNVSGTQTAW